MEAVTRQPVPVVQEADSQVPERREPVLQEEVPVVPLPLQRAAVPVLIPVVHHWS